MGKQGDVVARRPFGSWGAVALVACVAGCGVAAGEPERTALDGRVRTADGGAATGALVTATYEGGRSETVYTDDEGRFNLAAGATALRAWLPGSGEAEAQPATGPIELVLGAAPERAAPGSAWLAELPEGEDTRRFILDCTGCHVTDGSRAELQGARRDSAQWHAAVTQMTGMFGPGTGFPIISSWASPAPLGGWLARHFANIDPSRAPAVAASPAARSARLTEYDVPVPQDLPHDLMVAPGGEVVITGMFTHQMYVLDPSTGRFETTAIPVPGANPRALDIDDEGRWYVVLGGPGQVAVHEPDPSPAPDDWGPWQMHDVGMYAHSIDLAPDGRAWVNGHFTHRPELISAVDPTDGSIDTFEVPADAGTPDAESTIPYGLRVAPDGMVWGTQLRGNRLLRLDPSTGAVRQWTMPVSHAGPRRPDVAPDGSIWIPLYSANALARFDPSTERFDLWDFPVEGALPYVARVDQGDGTVWLGTGHGDLVASFDPASEAFTLYPLPTRGALIRHLDVDEERGEVWFAYGASPGIRGKVLRLRPGG